MTASEEYPQLYQQFLASWEKASNNRLWLVGIVFGLMLVCLTQINDPSLTTALTVVLVISAIWGIWWSQRHLKHLRDPEHSFESLIESLRAMAIGNELTQLDRELIETEEWTYVITTEHYLLWIGQVQAGKITSIENILALDYTTWTSRSGTHHSLRVQTKYIGAREIASSLNEIDDEFYDLHQMLTERHPQIILTRGAHDLFTPNKPRTYEDDTHRLLDRDPFLEQLNEGKR